MTLMYIIKQNIDEGESQKSQSIKPDRTTNDNKTPLYKNGVIFYLFIESTGKMKHEKRKLGGLTKNENRGGGGAFVVRPVCMSLIDDLSHVDLTFLVYIFCELYLGVRPM